MVIEYARNVAEVTGAGSTEFDPQTTEPGDLDDGGAETFVEGAGDLGGTMRLGIGAAIERQRSERFPLDESGLRRTYDDEA
jgi:CTP synthase